MKKYLSIALLTCAAISCMAQDDDHKLYMSKSLSNESFKDAEVETSGGSIDVDGGHTSDARIEVFVRTNTGRRLDLSKDEIQQKIKEDYDLSISVSNNKLTAIAKPLRRNMDWRKTLSISFKLYIPQNVSTDLSTSGGSISLANLSGTEEFRTSGGSLTVKKLTGKVHGETSGGSINVSDSKDDIDLHTSGGSIDAHDCIGKIRLNTSGGSLTLNDLNGDITATTSGGSVHGKTILGDLSTHTSGGSIHMNDLSCSLDASTSGGNIDVDIKEPGKFIKLNNSGGNITLQIPKNKGFDLRLYADKIKTDQLNNFSGSADDNSITGKINGGGIPVHVDAGSGHIYLAFK